MIREHVTVRRAIMRPGKWNFSVRGEDLQVPAPQPVHQGGSEQHLVEDIPQRVHFGVGLIVVVCACGLHGVPEVAPHRVVEEPELLNLKSAKPARILAQYSAAVGQGVETANVKHRIIEGVYIKVADHEGAIVACRFLRVANGLGKPDASGVPGLAVFAHLAGEVGHGQNDWDYARRSQRADDIVIGLFQDGAKAPRLKARVEIEPP